MTLHDAPARERIRTSVAESLCVEAGAGTGKTTVLVQRIVEVLRSGTASIDELAVITFTDKAAGELSTRVRQELERALDVGTREERGRIAEALAGLYRARIETIHTFAANLLRRRPVEARIDPGFEILSGLAADLDFDAAFRDWLGELLADPDADPALQAALNRGFDLEELREVAEVLHAHRQLLPLALDAPPPADPEAFLAAARAAVDRLPEIAQEATDPEDKGVVQIPGVVEFARRCLAAGDDPRELERTVLLRAPRKPPSATAGAQRSFADAARCIEMKALVKAFVDELAALQDAWRCEALLGVIGPAQDFVAAYAERRRSNGQADFDDILIWARDLLRDPEVRPWLHDRFKAVLVDEFQDTDPIQAEIVLALTSLDEGPWHERVPAPGRLVVVGDPKQSIYRFRGADITVYDTVKRGPLANGGETISTNFRTIAPVIAWCNTVFDELLVEVAGRQPGNVALLPSRAGEAPAVRALMPTLPADARDEDQRVAEAHAIAAWVARTVAQGTPVSERDGEGTRPARWRDVAILVPARTGVEAYEDALVAAGVPVRHEGGRGFFLRQEVRELISVLRAIDDPTDRISLVAALRATAFGCSDEDLFRYAQAGGVLDLRVPLREDGPGGPVADALAVLAGLRRERRGLTLAELVFQAIERVRMTDVALALPDGAQAAGNLVKVIDQARAFAASGGGGLRAFARWLAESGEARAEESDAGVVEESDDVVRIMTVHASKGLEFGFVVLANLFGSRSGRTGPIATNGTLHFKVGTSSRRGEFATPGWEQRKEEERAFAEAERLRLLYVAATRARDGLVIAAPVREGKQPAPSSLLAKLAPFLPGGGGADEHVEAVAHDAAHEPPPAPVAPAPDAAALEDAQAQARAWVERREALRATGAVEREVVPASQERLRAERPLGPALGTDDDPLILGEGPPRDIGEALHRVMELIDLPHGEQLAAIARAVCAQAGIPDHVAEIEALARACLASPALARVAQADAVYRELPYAVPRAEGYGVGTVDLLLREGDRLVVVDYKTDAIGPEAAAAHAEEHRAQLEAYAAALERATGLAADEAILVFPRAGTEQALALARPG